VGDFPRVWQSNGPRRQYLAKGIAASDDSETRSQAAMVTVAENRQAWQEPSGKAVAPSTTYRPLIGTAGARSSRASLCAVVGCG